MCAKVLCKQNELKKPLNKIAKTINEAYRRGWDILSHHYVDDCAKNQSLLGHELSSRCDGFTGTAMKVTVQCSSSRCSGNAAANIYSC